MADDRTRRLAQLRQAYKSGILDEDTYQATVAALGLGPGPSHGHGRRRGCPEPQRGGRGGRRGCRRRRAGQRLCRPAAADPAEALRIYRRVLVSTCCHLPLRGVDVGASDPTGGQQRLELAQVYVGLTQRAGCRLPRRKRRTRAATGLLGGARDPAPARAGGRGRQPAPGAAGRSRWGKSTFVGHLALCLAAPRLEPEAGLAGAPSRLAAGKRTPLPILVVLRDFARWLPDGR